MLRSATLAMSLETQGIVLSAIFHMAPWQAQYNCVLTPKL